MRRALIAEDFLKTTPLCVFVIVYLFKFESEARTAAFYMLRNPMISSKVTNGVYPSLELDNATDDKRIIAAAQKIRTGAAGEGRRPFRIVKPEASTMVELERISATTLQRLQQYYIDCEQAARAVAESKDWLKDTNAAWLSCSICAGKAEEDEVPKAGAMSGVAHWWRSYMFNTANAFMTAPCPETVTKPYLIQEMYRQAGACKHCRKCVFTAMPDFCKSYAAAVEEAIRKVKTLILFSMVGGTEKCARWFWIFQCSSSSGCILRIEFICIGTSIVVINEWSLWLFNRHE